jgi:predicted transglutaminase-like cysteine proteinase
MTCVVQFAGLLRNVVLAGSFMAAAMVGSTMASSVASAADPVRPATAGLPEPSRLGRNINYAPNDRQNDRAPQKLPQVLQAPLGSDSAAAPFMRIYGQANPPYGVVQFCESFPKECVSADSNDGRFDATPERFEELDAVNRYVNTVIEPVTDQDLYGVPEWWAIPSLRADGTGKGDCEDYALLKRQILIKRGWPVNSVLMTVVRDEKGDGHAVLTARTAQGDFILDNKATDIRLWSKTPYKFIMRQSYLNVKVWMSLDPKETVTPGPMAAAKPGR